MNAQELDHLLSKSAYQANQILVSRGINEVYLIGGGVPSFSKVYAGKKITVQHSSELPVPDSSVRRAYMIGNTSGPEFILARLVPLMSPLDYLFLLGADDATVKACEALVEDSKELYKMFFIGDTKMAVVTSEPNPSFPFPVSNMVDSELRGAFPIQQPTLPYGRPQGKKIYGWMHVACMHGGNLIASELHGQLEQSGLLDKTHNVFVSMVGDSRQRAELREYLFGRHGDTYRIVHDSPDISEYEWPALKHMWALSQEEDFLGYYLHTKGASNCRPDVSPAIQQNIRNWRYCMSHFVVNKHSSCISALNSGSVDACGPLYNPCLNEGMPGIFAGNFWWATSPHLKTLPDPVVVAGPPGSNRMGAESWVCGRADGRYLSTYWHESTDPYDFACVYPEGGPLKPSRWSDF